MTAMDPDRWRQLQDLFAAARAHAPAERERLLGEVAFRDPALVHLAVAPEWDSLRGDPRFAERLRSMRLSYAA